MQINAFRHPLRGSDVPICCIALILNHFSVEKNRLVANLMTSIHVLTLCTFFLLRVTELCMSSKFMILIILK